MAKIAPKGKKVTGTKKKDKIVSTGKGVWKKALTVKAGAGNDIINFKKSKYKNIIYGDAGNDIIYGGTKNDKITGGKGNDVIYTGKGTNIVYLNKGDGKDTLYHQGKKTTIAINKSNKSDKVSFTKQGNDLVMTYQRKGVKAKKAEAVTVKNYFNEDGSVNTKIASAVLLNSKKYKNKKLQQIVKSFKIVPDGNKLIGSASGDKLNATAASQYINGGLGNDTIKGLSGNNTLLGGAGDDDITGGSGNDSIDGGAGNDIIKGTAGNNTLLGGAGDDDITGGNGNDSIDGGAGNDIINGTAGNNTLLGGAGDDNITGGNGNDSIDGGEGEDTINAGKGNNTIFINKGDGSDIILNGGGTDTLVFKDETPLSPEEMAPPFAMGGSVWTYWDHNAIDLIVVGDNGHNAVMLKDYGKGNHSVKYITVGNRTFTTDSLIEPNYIEESDTNGIYQGTPKPDYITVQDYGMNARVYADAADDNITVRGNGTNNSTPPVLVDSGSGNDTIHLQQYPFVNLLLNAGTGNDTVYGVSSGGSGKNNYLNLDYGDNPDLLIRKVGEFSYILGEVKGDDLIVKLTNGETITIIGYNNLDDAGKNCLNFGAYSKGEHFAPVSTLLCFEEPEPEEEVITLTPNNRTYYNVNYKIPKTIMTDGNTDYSVTLLGNVNKNEVYITGHGYHDVTIGNGNQNIINIGIPADSSEEEEHISSIPVDGNVTVNVGDGSGNRIEISTTKISFLDVGNGNGNNINIKTAQKSRVGVGNGYGNTIYSYATEENEIITGSGQNTIYCGYNAGTAYSQNTITSCGHDVIFVEGNTNIYFNGNGDKTKQIKFSPKLNTTGNTKLKTTVFSTENAEKVNIQINPGTLTPYYSLYDENNDGKYDMIYSALDINTGKDADREVGLTAGYVGGEYVPSINTDYISTKLCDMERANLTTLDTTSDSTVYKDSTFVIDSLGNDTITIGGSTIVILKSGSNTVNHGGNGTVYVYGGENTINISGSNTEKTVKVQSNTQTVINDVMNLIPQSESTNPLVINFADQDFTKGDVMVYHNSNGEDGLHFVTRHNGLDVEVTGIYDGSDTNYLIETDGKLPFAKFAITDKNGDGATIQELTNYWDMANHSNVFYNENSAIVNTQGGSQDWLIDGTDVADSYTIDLPSDIGTKIDIYDLGGETDVLCFENDSFYQNIQGGQHGYSTFFDVNITRNNDNTLASSTFGNDLYFSGNMVSLFDTVSTNDTYACIHNYFDGNSQGAGYIESIIDENNSAIDFNKLTALKGEVASWIAGNTSDCYSVSDVIAKHSDLTSQLMAVFTNKQTFID